MRNVLIWDLPTRMFHWLLAAGFAASAVIALVLGDDHELFPYHAIIGLCITLLVGLRLAWGIVGTRYAKFGAFLFGPRAIATYMKGVITGGGPRYVGHNPGSSVAIFAMLGLILGLALTGVSMGRGNESVKEVHELLAWLMVGFVVAHLLGVVIHTLRHRENITASMIHGRKHADLAEAIGSAKPIAAVLFLIISGAWAIGIMRSYTPATQTATLPLVGISLQLGEADEGEERDRNDHEEDDRD